MAKPKVFISSTYYDLKQVRSDLDSFIESLGYDVVRNEEGDIPYGKDEALEEYCYKEIKNVDILISIIGGRFGTESKRNSSSISQIELRTAIKENKQIYIFIEKNVFHEFETYFINKNNESMKYRFANDVKIYQFIEEVRGMNTNNNIKDFETATDISKYLKEQFAGLFNRFLEENTRSKEISLIKSLEQTAQTLNKMVNFLTNENKGQAEEINRILMINHPLTEALKTKLNIPFNFYIEGRDDLFELLLARGFEYQFLSDNNDYLEWVKAIEDKMQTLRISVKLFDDEKKLKFVKKTDWDDMSINLTEMDVQTYDDLPF